MKTYLCSDDRNPTLPGRLIPSFTAWPRAYVSSVTDEEIDRASPEEILAAINAAVNEQKLISPFTQHGFREDAEAQRKWLREVAKFRRDVDAGIPTGWFPTPASFGALR